MTDVLNETNTDEPTAGRAAVSVPDKAPPLSWSRLDVEQRLGFSGGRYTSVNGLLASLSALIMTLVFYAAIVPFDGTFFGDMFTKRGPTQYCTVFFSCWSIVILFVKWRKLKLQRRALDYSVVPESHDFVLSVNTTEQVAQQIAMTVDDPKHFLLFNRIMIALSNLRNLGRVTDVDDILRSQAEQDESSMESSYALVHGFVWAVPVLGFIGTVLGLSQAIGGFSSILGSAKDISEISGALKGVTAGLATAFETTLVALVAALGIQLLLTGLKRAEEEFFDDCAEYCLRNVVNRLRIMPYQPEHETP